MTQPSQPDDADRAAGYAVAAWIIAILLTLVGLVLIASTSNGLDPGDAILGMVCAALGVVGIFTTLAAGIVSTAIRHTAQSAAANTPAPWPTVGQPSPWQPANLTQQQGPLVPQQPSQPQ